MAEVEVVYENGVLRPSQPLDFEDGTRLEVTVTRIIAPAAEHDQNMVDETAYQAFLRALDSIADLPLESTAQTNTARDHDAILYPARGRMP